MKISKKNVSNHNLAKLIDENFLSTWETMFSIFKVDLLDEEQCQNIYDKNILKFNSEFEKSEKEKIENTRKLFDVDKSSLILELAPFL